MHIYNYTETGDLLWQLLTGQNTKIPYQHTILTSRHSHNYTETGDLLWQLLTGQNTKIPYQHTILTSRHSHNYIETADLLWQLLTGQNTKISYQHTILTSGPAQSQFAVIVTNQLKHKDTQKKSGGVGGVGDTWEGEGTHSGPAQNRTRLQDRPVQTETTTLLW